MIQRESLNYHSCEPQLRCFIPVVEGFSISESPLMEFHACGLLKENITGISINEENKLWFSAEN